ncbi:MAG: IS110 family transposase [Anaerolineae bacterium]|nr:IS110 family transposase [Anaerolineae bacterium]
MSNPLLVGVDLHRKTNTVCLMDGQGREVAPRFTVENNRPGTEAFIHQVARRVVAGDFDAIHIAAEATGWFWWHFFQTLDQDPFLNQWPLALYPFNPRLTAHFKKTYVDLDHSDPLDAFVAADRLRLGRDLPAPFHYEELYLPVRLLTRYRFHLVHNLAKEKAYCLAFLYLKISEYTRKDKRPFSSVFGAASRAVLQEFASIEEIAAIPFDELVEFIDCKGKRRFPDPAENARKLLQVARDSYHLPEALTRPINLILGMSLKHISFLERQEKRLASAIAERMELIPHTLDTIPGFGPVFSGGIIAEIAGVERFDYNQAKVAKYAGLKWRKHRSADFEADETRLTRTGNRYLRYYLCEAANQVRMRDPEYAAYYDRKFHEVRKHQHKRAIVLTARKLVRLVVRLLTTNQPYRPRRR